MTCSPTLLVLIILLYSIQQLFGEVLPNMAALDAVRESLIGPSIAVHLFLA